MIKAKRILLMTGILALVLLAACSPAGLATKAPAASKPDAAPSATPKVEASNMPEIHVDAADFSYKVAEPVHAGWVRVKLTNSGQEAHHIQFLRLNDGVTIDQFKEAIKQGEGPALALTKQVGGVGAVAPGIAAEAILNLPAGEYVIMCFVPSPGDHTAHFVKGMLQSLTVQPASGTTASEPSADMIVRMMDFSYDLPDTLPAKPVTIQVVNNGPEPHELNVLRLADGKTVADVMVFLATPDGPPPFTPVGGMNGLDKDVSGYMVLDLAPGNYVAICNIPSPKAEGHPHFALGMIKGFTIANSQASGASVFPTGRFVSVSDSNYEYEFRDDHTWSYYLGGLMGAKGSYQIDQNLWIEQGTKECPFTGKYQWAYDGKNLTFKLQGEDACAPRREATDGQTFTLVN